MQVGFVGLGRMGAAMVARLRRHKHLVVAYDRNPEAVQAVARFGARPADSLGALMGQLRAPRVVWLMVPAGAPVGAVLRGLESHLAPGDIVIDGGNSRYTDSCERARAFQQAGVHFLDVGTSGAGHFVKMVHNGIEYGLLQAYGEGFELLADSDFKLDLHQVARLWNRGSVVRSWLLELAEAALARARRLGPVRGYVEDSGEGRWTLQEAASPRRGSPWRCLPASARGRKTPSRLSSSRPCGGSSAATRSRSAK